MFMSVMKLEKDVSNNWNSNREEGWQKNYRKIMNQMSETIENGTEF